MAAHDDERAGVSNTRRHMELVFSRDEDTDPLSFLDEPPHKPKPSQWEMLRIGMLGGIVIAALGWLLLEIASRR